MGVQPEAKSEGVWRDTREKEREKEVCSCKCGFLHKMTVSSLCNFRGGIESSFGEDIFGEDIEQVGAAHKLNSAEP